MEVGILYSSGILTNKNNFFEIQSDAFLVTSDGLVYTQGGKIIYPDGNREPINSDSQLIGFIQFGQKIIHVYNNYNTLCNRIKFGQNIKILGDGHVIASDRYFCYPGMFSKMHELNGIILHATPIYDDLYRVYTLSDKLLYTCYHISEHDSAIVCSQEINILDKFDGVMVFQVGVLKYVVDKKTSFASLVASEVMDLYRNGPNMILEYENSTVCIPLGQDYQITIQSPKNKLKSARVNYPIS